MRSANRGNSYNAWYVNSTGNVNNNNANNGYRCAPDWVSQTARKPLHSEAARTGDMQGAERLPETANNAAVMRSSCGMVPLYTPQKRRMMDVEEITGFEALYNSMNKCARGVLWKDSVASFYHNWIRETLRLEKELRNGTYKERMPKFFVITEPKKREIMSISFRDRIYQRSLNDNAIYPQTARSFIYDNHACQKGKGTGKARERLICFLQRYYRRYGADGYVLQCDIKGYYPNMHHNVAKQVLKRYLDNETYQMAAAILDNFPGEVGFNPGSQIVQNVGIAALDKMDHYIKERLGIRYYLRIMDDFILIHQDREKLEHCLTCIKEILAGMRMELSTEKTGIYELKRGIRFIGFYFRITGTGKVVVNIDPRKVKHERRKLRRMANLVKKGEKTKRSVDEHFRSWKVHASYGDSYRLIKRMDAFYQSLWEDDHDFKKEKDINTGSKEAGEHGGKSRKAGSAARLCGDHGGRRPAGRKRGDGR